MKLNFLKTIALFSFCFYSNLTLAASDEVPISESKFSGNVGVTSKYIYHGGVENDDLAVQGGLEYSHQSGINIGYWGSTLDYDATDSNRHNGFESDVYITYDHQVNQNLKYRVQTTAYIYHRGGTIRGEENDHRRTTGYEALAAVDYKNFNLATSVMLADVSYANAGDVYLCARYTYPLAHEFELSASVGGSAYNSSHDDSLIETEKDFAFNEARIGLSKSFENTGLTASMDYFIGGKDRLGDDYDNHFVVGLNYGF